MKLTFSVGDAVSVNLSNLPGFDAYGGCHMDGTVRAMDGGMLDVLLVNNDSVQVDAARVERIREADEGVEWAVGDKVEVLEETDGVKGWWEASIVKKKGKNEWTVKFMFAYESAPEKKSVPGSSLRRAGSNFFDPNWEKVNQAKIFLSFDEGLKGAKTSSKKQKPVSAVDAEKVVKPKTKRGAAEPSAEKERIDQLMRELELLMKHEGDLRFKTLASWRRSNGELEEEVEKEKEEEERSDEGLLNQKNLPSKKRAANEEEVEFLISSKSDSEKKKKKKKISTKKRGSEGPIEWDLTMHPLVKSVSSVDNGGAGLRLILVCSQRGRGNFGTTLCFADEEKLKEIGSIVDDDDRKKVIKRLTSALSAFFSGKKIPQTLRDALETTVWGKRALKKFE